MARFGCLLMVLAFVALAALVVLPVIGPFRDNALLMSIQAAINCPPGYSFENEFTTYRPRPGETIEAATGFCISPDGKTRTEMSVDEQGRYFVIAVAAFIIPFIVGLLMFIGGVGRATSRATQREFQQNTLFGTSNLATPISGMGSGSSSPISGLSVGGTGGTSSSGVNLDPKTADLVKRMTGIDVNAPGANVQVVKSGSADPVVFSSGFSSGAPGSSSLSERLRQIDDAKSQGLISQEEYDRLRKAILDDHA